MPQVIDRKCVGSTFVLTYQSA